MRKFIALTLYLTFSICINARSAKAWVQKLDLVDIATLEATDVPSFWIRAREADDDYKSLKRALLKNKKSANQAVSNIRRFLSSSSSDRYYETVYDSTADSICKRIETDLRIEDLRQAFPSVLRDDLEFKIANRYELNASTFPDGYIMLNQGLVSMLNYDELLAVCTHELVHYMMKHSLLGEYAYIKKQKSNKLWAEIGGGLLIGVSAFSDSYTAGVTGQDTYSAQYYANMYQGIIDGAAESTERFKFRYSRKDELQADIIGCRYLQFLGYDPDAFISMLEKLGTESDRYYNKKSTHPKTNLRIKVIKALLDRS